jgi:DNA (cytosine-5)-methyltransferase 1
MKLNPKMKLNLSESSTPLSQEFFVEDDRVVRRITAGAHQAETFLELDALGEEVREHGVAKAWTLAMLRGARAEPLVPPSKSFRVVDLFCGAGGFSAGIASAAFAAGFTPEFAACVDLDPASLEVFARNLRPRLKMKRNVDSLLDYAVRYHHDKSSFPYRPEILDAPLADEVGKVDLVIGGPPCQGHSNLNNHTRRSDLRNALYLTVPAMAVALGAKAVVIENVQSVLRDHSKVVDKARSILAESYHVQEAVLEAEKLGVAQSRKRHFLVATSKPAPPLSQLHNLLHLPKMTVWDVVSDLAGRFGPAMFDVPAELSEQNRQRVDFLFDNNTHNLPNAERPDCHKEGHTYPSVYGRLFADQPSGTITGGFLSPGRGRYVHPTERRGLTPHEGARLQGFPDSFDFSRQDGEKLGNKDYSKLIGDAVPPPLGYAIGLACIASL